MTLALLLSVYDRVDDCMAHLDILRYATFPHETIIAAMDPIFLERFRDDLAGRVVINLPSPGFSLGPLLSLVNGVRAASRRGHEWLLYRNADDWLFNHTLVEETLAVLKSTGQRCAGYNWMGRGTFAEFAMNELYLHVPSFMETVDEAESYFTRSKPWLCEYKMARWVRRTIHDDPCLFHRLSGRELPTGIGLTRTKKAQRDAQFQESVRHNGRFFNRPWQMIGSHENQERLGYYQDIRSQIPYAERLEREKHFSRWLQTARQGGEWNVRLAGSSGGDERPVPTENRVGKRIPAFKRKHGDQRRLG